MKMQSTVFLLVAGILSAMPGFTESLYQAGSYKPLMLDHRSYKPGEVLTVLIYENASATSSASTRAGRESKLGASSDDGWTQLGGHFNLDNDFAGQGQYTRSEKLVATVSVTVQDVLDNGDLVVKGEQNIELNHEKQRIAVSGKVRPVDISTQNTVLSNRLADANIELIGKGLISNRQKPGLLTRFFHWLF